MPGENPLSIQEMPDHIQVTSYNFSVTPAAGVVLLLNPTGGTNDPGRDIVVDKIFVTIASSSTSNNAQLAIAASGTAITAGTNFGQALDGSTLSPNTHTEWDLTDSSGNYSDNVIAPGYSLGIKSAFGTATGMSIHIYWRSKRR